MATSLATLLAEPSEKQIVERLIAVLKNARDATGRNPFIVNDFSSGSAAKTIIDMVANGLKFEVADIVPLIASAGFGDYAEGEWLDLFVEQFFGITRDAAVATRQTVKLWCDETLGPYNINAGFLVVRSKAGRLYRNVDAVVVPLGTDPITAIDAVFEAEAASAEYIDGPSTLVTAGLVTPLPGLNCENEQLEFSEVTLNGSGTGVITPSRTNPGTAPNQHSTIKVTILSTGLVGAGSLSVELDFNPATLQTITPIPASLNVLEASGGANSGTTLTFDDSAGTAPFVAGDTYTVSTPSSPIIRQGRDKESDASYLARARQMWAGLSDVPLDDTFALWVQQCSQENELGVTKVVVSASDVVAGVADIVIAGAVNPLPGLTQTTIQAYVDARTGVLDKGNVRLAVTVALTATGTVRVKASKLAAAKLAAQAAWEAYLALLPIGGEKDIGGVVVLDELHEALMGAGAIDVTGLALAADPVRTISAEGDVVLNVDDVATIDAALEDSLTWVAV